MSLAAASAEAEAVQPSQKNARALTRRVVGPFLRHCAACGLDPAGAYVTAPLIGIGVTPTSATDASTAEQERDGPRLLDQIVAFDRAEADSANLTQTNLVQVSSFNGPQGLLLGYDILRQDLVRHPLLCETAYPHVFDAAPLFAATQALFGTVAAPRFAVRPGQPLLCAYKTLYHPGPCRLYGALAVAIAHDHVQNADLFLEDHGRLPLDEEDDPHRCASSEAATLVRLVDAVLRIGDNLSVRYERVFVGLRSRVVPADHVGCVLTAAPYVHLAQDAVPLGEGPEALVTLSLAQWEQAVFGSDAIAGRSTTPQ